MAKRALNNRKSTSLMVRTVVIVAVLISSTCAVISPARAAVCPTVDANGVVTPQPVDVGQVDWSGCALMGVDLSNQNLVNANFQGADLTDADFTNSDLEGVNFSYANLSNANLTDATVDANFTGASIGGIVGDQTTWSGKCPDGVYIQAHAYNQCDGAITQILRGSSISRTTIRPYVDGYQDNIRVGVTAYKQTSGSIKILGAKNRTIKSWKLSSNTHWTTLWTGRTSAGKAAAPGRYRLQVRLYLGRSNKLVINQFVNVKNSQVVITKLAKSRTLLYSRRDGYGHTVTFTVRSSLPSRGSLKIKRGNTVVRTYQLGRSTSWSIDWNGRKANGKLLNTGAYSVVVSLIGGQGVAKRAETSIKISTYIDPVDTSGGSSSSCYNYDEYVYWRDSANYWYLSDSIDSVYYYGVALDNQYYYYDLWLTDGC